MEIVQKNTESTESNTKEVGFAINASMTKYMIASRNISQDHRKTRNDDVEKAEKF